MTTLLRAGVVSLLFASTAVHASPIGLVPNYDFDWATITDVGNEPFRGIVGGVPNQEAGSVGYVYRIAKTEITTRQWLEFINTFAPQSETPISFLRPTFWGGRSVSAGVYTLNPFIENAANVPVIGLTWREAAMYVNWLHNDKSANPSAITNGAYDTSTFGEVRDESGKLLSITDQLTRSPDAKFWLPTYDEWMKAVYYDPNKNGPGQAGYWMFPHSSDEAPIYAPPDQGGDANSRFTLPDSAARHIPVGAYPHAASPWGLLDAAGAASEWLEDVITPDLPLFRLFGGSQMVSGIPNDLIGFQGGTNPFFPFGSFRVASAVVPSAPTSAVFVVCVVLSVRKRRRES